MGSSAEATGTGANPRVDLLSGKSVDADDDRALLSEVDLAAEEEQEIEAISAATAGPHHRQRLFATEQALLDEMSEIAEANRALPDARVKKFIDWIRENMCPGLPDAGRRLERHARDRLHRIRRHEALSPPATQRGDRGH